MKGDGGSGVWHPAIEVGERNGKLQVHAELPSLKPEDVKVKVADDALIIQGERKYEHEDNEEGIYRSERRYGQFYREIPLPEGANAEQAKATFKDGVLEVVLSVQEAKSNRRTIAIETGIRRESGS
ncbi:MAG TPA: Hsp20/alpha crystallin family protein [Bryobacteraceae bacterium]|nr:Hsp20/alpha crystallin family protein [Bryobacteraceae bacterium]